CSNDPWGLVLVARPAPRASSSGARRKRTRGLRFLFDRCGGHDGADHQPPLGPSPAAPVVRSSDAPRVASHTAGGRSCRPARIPPVRVLRLGLAENLGLSFCPAPPPGRGKPRRGVGLTPPC